LTHYKDHKVLVKRKYLIISDEALIHSSVFFLHRIDSQHRIIVTQINAILEPGNALDRVTFVVAFESGKAAIVYDLLLWLDFNRQWS